MKIIDLFLPFFLFLFPGRLLHHAPGLKEKGVRASLGSTTSPEECLPPYLLHTVPVAIATTPEP